MTDQVNDLETEDFCKSNASVLIQWAYSSERQMEQ